MKSFSPGKFVQQNSIALTTLIALLLLPFIIGILNGDSPAAVWQNEAGES